jgi:hypothetical protein
MVIMTRKENDQHFAADIDSAIWAQFEEWTKGRSKYQNKQIGDAVFRLFVNAPNAIKHLAFAGTGTELQTATAEWLRFLAAQAVQGAVTESEGLPETQAQSRVESRQSRKQRGSQAG